MSKAVTANYRIPKAIYIRSWKPLSRSCYSRGVTDNRHIISSHLLPYFLFSLKCIYIRLQQVASEHNFSRCLFAPFSRSLIIRGIGYRLYPLLNLAPIDDTITSSGLGYTYSRYIYLRAGHSFQTYCGVPNGIGLRSLKRERKIVVYGFSEGAVSTLADRLFYYRPPNAFTGRGIRFKKVYYRRKPGKRAQKGRGF